MTLKTLVMLAFQLSLLLTVFGFGLQATHDDILYLLRRPGLLARSLIAMFVIVPVAVVALVRASDTPRMEEIVLVALAISPIPPMLPKKAHHAGVTTGYALGLLTVASLFSIVSVPSAAYLLGLYFGRPFAMSSAAIAKMIVQAVVLPIIAGIVVQRSLPDVARHIGRPVGIIAGALLAAATLVLVGGNISTLWRLSEVSTLLLMVAFVVIGLAAGDLLGGPGIEHEGVLAVASASRHPGIALALASANYPNERFGGTVLLYLVVSAVVCIPYIKWKSARHVLSPRD